MGAKVDNVCNHCRLEKLREDAKLRHRYVRLRPSTLPGGGVNVYETPDATQHYDLKEGTSDHVRYFKKWFQAIPDNCVC